MEVAVGIFCERALENSGHVFGQQRSDGDQAGANHGRVDLEYRPDHYVDAAPCLFVRVGSLR